MLIISNFAYAGTSKYVSHAVMLCEVPVTLCGMDVNDLRNRIGQEWELQETNEPSSVGCLKCLRHLTPVAADGLRQARKRVRIQKKLKALAAKSSANRRR